MDGCDYFGVIFAQIDMERAEAKCTFPLHGLGNCTSASEIKLCWLIVTTTIIHGIVNLADDVIVNRF